MRDFTLTTYEEILQVLHTNGYSFQTFQNFFQQPNDKTVILRHDVDRYPENALLIARIEKEVGIKATYYFRVVKESYDEDIIKQITKMGHEIGYHYENLSAVNNRKDFREVKDERSKEKGVKSKEKLFELAIDDFRLNLEKLRTLYPVKTICMHGSPLSKWDNRDLWKKFDYRDYGIIAEPYFDVDFGEVLYLTDTGRRWDGDSVSVRDKVEVAGGRGQGSGERCEESGVRNLKLRKTWDIIEAVERGLLPDKIMINTHPQRWTDNPLEWTTELIWQNVKNVLKRVVVRRGKPISE